MKIYIGEQQRFYLQCYYTGFVMGENGENRPEIDPESRFETESMQDGWDDAMRAFAW